MARQSIKELWGELGNWETVTRGQRIFLGPSARKLQNLHQDDQGEGDKTQKIQQVMPIRHGLCVKAKMAQQSTAWKRLDAACCRLEKQHAVQRPVSHVTRVTVFRQLLRYRCRQHPVWPLSPSHKPSPARSPPLQRPDLLLLPAPSCSLLLIQHSVHLLRRLL